MMNVVVILGKNVSQMLRLNQPPLFLQGNKKSFQCKWFELMPWIFITTVWLGNLFAIHQANVPED